MVVTDILKRFLNSGQIPSLYYLRTRDGLEVDLAVEYEQKLHLLEIKSAMTIFPKHAASLSRISADLKPFVKTSAIISMAAGNFPVTKNICSYNYKNILGV
jgi:uncharacterized protein